MGAVAYAIENGSNQTAGDAAGEGLNLWQQAETRTAEILLADLLKERETVRLNEDNSETSLDAIDMNILLGESEAVHRVQQALEELGFAKAQPVSAKGSGGRREAKNGGSTPCPASQVGSSSGSGNLQHAEHQGVSTGTVTQVQQKGNRNINAQQYSDGIAAPVGSSANKSKSKKKKGP